MLSKKEFIKKLGGVEAILFDIDHTLLNTFLATTKASENCAKVINTCILPMDKERIDPERTYALLKEIGDKRSDGIIDVDSFEEIAKRMGLDSENNYNTIVKMRIAWEDSFRANLELYPDVLPFFTRQQKKYEGKNCEKVLFFGIISNGNPNIQLEKLIRMGIDGFFDDFQISPDIKIQKPEIDMFNRAMDVLGVTAPTSAYIGDRLDKDICGANRAGMLSIRINRGGSRYDDQQINEGDKNMIPDYEIESLTKLEEYMC